MKLEFLKNGEARMNADMISPGRGNEAGGGHESIQAASLCRHSTVVAYRMILQFDAIVNLLTPGWPQ
jgi:hypothetical protein